MFDLFSFVGCRGLVMVGCLHLARQARRAGSGCGAWAGRPGHRPGSPAVLGLQAPPPNSLRALRALRSDSGGEHVHEARCARGPETLRSSAPLRRATTHPHPPSLPGCLIEVIPTRSLVIHTLARGRPAAVNVRTLLFVCGRQSVLPQPWRRSHASSCIHVSRFFRSSRQRGAAGGDFGVGEKRSDQVGARSAHPEHTRRRFLSAASAGREASSAARPGQEHRSGVGLKADRPRMSPRRPPAVASGTRPSIAKQCDEQRGHH